MRQPETYSLAPPPDRKDAAEEAELLSEEFRALLRQLGPPEGFWGSLTADLPRNAIHSANSLPAFLEAYQTQVLVPLEMPAITRARSHAARGHLRELIALDRELETKAVWPAFASASRRIGRAQLERLRPLRDERTVRRYLAAVQAGQAAGWHTVVFGLTLAVYSLPLRHGLLAYARQTLAGLALAAAGPRASAAPACQEKLQSLLRQIPAAIQQTLASCAEATIQPLTGRDSVEP
jgi:urease accessory protein UreF